MVCVLATHGIVGDDFENGAFDDVKVGKFHKHLILNNYVISLLLF